MLKSGSAEAPRKEKHKKLAPLPQDLRKTLPASPLDFFPSKKDTFSGLFFAVEKKKHTRKLEDNLRWLHADTLDPNFGLEGTTQQDDIRRAYRRIESSKLFAPVAAKDAPLSEIVPKVPTLKSFVVVEESRLQGLMRLERTLRREKDMLGEQCGWALTDFHTDARVPLPASLLAVRSFCDAQMKKQVCEVRALAEKWALFCREKRYDKPHLYMQDSYVKSAPVAQRGMKLRLVRDAEESRRLRKDRDAMLFEDDMSYLIGKHHQAGVRKLDYERYYILAARYGPYDEERFGRDARPGGRYFVAAISGATKFQNLWARFWAVRRLARYRAAKTVQKHWRRKMAWKKYHVIIMLRLKIGKKTYYYFCWYSWLRYNQICRSIKEALRYQFENFRGKYFYLWKENVAKARDSRRQKARQIILHSKNNGLYTRWVRWLEYNKGQRKLKQRLRRLFGFPHFDFWFEFVQQSKTIRRIHLAAARIQGLCLMLKAKFLFSRQRKAVNVLFLFHKMLGCMRRVKARRRQVVMLEFDAWAPEETARRNQRANEVERQRIVRRQHFVQEEEKGALAALRKHLASSDGKQQLDAIMSSGMLERWTQLHKTDAAPAKKSEKLAYIKKKLLAECSRVIRLLEAHNYNAKNPGFLACPDTRCHAVFTSEAQYHSHLSAAPHCGQPEFSHFHVVMRHEGAQELLRTYLAQGAQGGAVDYLDAWYAIQEWKRTPSKQDSFSTRAVGILQTFLLDSPRKLDITGLPKGTQMVDLLKNVQARKHKGLYRPTQGRRGFMQMFGRSSTYFEFSTDDVLTPDVFRELEWMCFMRVFTVVSQDPLWPQSGEFVQYVKWKEEEAVRRHADYILEYERYRLLKFGQWGRTFQAREKEAAEMAERVVFHILREEIETWFEGVERDAVRQRVAEVRHGEQEAHEGRQLVLDDAVFWVGENLMDSMYSHYTVALIDTMLRIPNVRVGLLEYAGLTQRGMHFDFEDTAVSKDAWFAQLFEQAKRHEELGTSSDMADACLVIQRAARGGIGRTVARKVFKKNFIKIEDPDTGYVLYHNKKTGRQSFEKPALAARLAPNAKW
ncbi:hypothetical protein B484DRAFT_398488 [Ochromonadaceae sp. CCMP2298]|nr:hypothetical protein B484DRAFT_398488 [Ochromonadaceae sp. CCMP2298]|mmetsp:Transcript_28545/g.64656  ORF Transcript_28545/g.64656 Transcript_28545/m.64656 type:complete len:1071 (+) Transcript_28545:138-3350(+)